MGILKSRARCSTRKPGVACVDGREIPVKKRSGPVKPEAASLLILFRHQEGVSSTTEREAGFLEAIKKIPGIEVILENRYAGATASEAQLRAIGEYYLCRIGNIVEADYPKIRTNLQVRKLKSLNDSKGHDIIETQSCSRAFLEPWKVSFLSGC